MSVRKEGAIFVLSIDQSKIEEDEAGFYTFKVMLIETKSKYSKFEGTFTEYSLEVDIIPAPVENATEPVGEEVIAEPEV